MDDKIITVDELVRMFVAISYIHEQRIFKFIDIYKYIERCYQYEDDSYRDRILFPDLISEAGEVVDELVKDETLSYVYPDGDYGMYRINNKIDILELAKLDNDYLADMIQIFFDILGGMPYMVTLKLSRPKRKV